MRRFSSKSSITFGPWRLALYMASSASRSSVSELASSPSPAIATPMLMVTSRSPISVGIAVGHLGAHPVGDEGRGVDVREVLAEHHELVAADPGDGVLGADGGRQSRRDGLEHGVADLVPVGVVDVLEAVDVAEQQR